MTDIENKEDEDDDKDSGTESDCEPTPVILITQNAKDALTETIMKRAVKD